MLSAANMCIVLPKPPWKRKMKTTNKELAKRTHAMKTPTCTLTRTATSGTTQGGNADVGGVN